MTKPLRVPLRSSPFPITADLTTDRVTALGVTGTGVTDLCRKLLAIGIDPVTPLDAYRGTTLSLKVRTIGEGAQLEVTTSNAGAPVFRKDQKARVGAAPVAPTAPTLPSAPPDEINAPTAVTPHGESDDDVIERIERQLLERHDPGEPEPDEWGQP